MMINLHKILIICFKQFFNNFLLSSSTLCLTPFVFANAAHPRWGQVGFQEPASPIMEGIIDFHHDLMFFLAFILGFVCWFLVNIGYMFFNRFPATMAQRRKRHTKHINFIRKSSLINHNLWLEIIWTVIPALILVSIVLPSFALIYSMDEFFLHPRLTLKAIGNQWYWTYNYGCALEYGQKDESLEDKALILKDKRHSNAIPEGCIVDLDGQTACVPSSIMNELQELQWSSLIGPKLTTLMESLDLSSLLFGGVYDGNKIDPIKGTLYNIFVVILDNLTEVSAIPFQYLKDKEYSLEVLLTLLFVRPDKAAIPHIEFCYRINYDDLLTLILHLAPEKFINHTIHYNNWTFKEFLQILLKSGEHQQSPITADLNFFNGALAQGDNYDIALYNTVLNNQRRCFIDDFERASLVLESPVGLIHILRHLDCTIDSYRLDALFLMIRSNIHYYYQHLVFLELFDQYHAFLQNLDCNFEPDQILNGLIASGIFDGRIEPQLDSPLDYLKVLRLLRHEIDSHSIRVMDVMFVEAFTHDLNGIQCYEPIKYYFEFLENLDCNFEPDQILNGLIASGVFEARKHFVTENLFEYLNMLKEIDCDIDIYTLNMIFSMAYRTVTTPFDRPNEAIALYNYLKFMVNPKGDSDVYRGEDLEFLVFSFQTKRDIYILRQYHAFLQNLDCNFEPDQILNGLIASGIFDDSTEISKPFFNNTFLTKLYAILSRISENLGLDKSPVKPANNEYNLVQGQLVDSLKDLLIEYVNMYNTTHKPNIQFSSTHSQEIVNYAVDFLSKKKFAESPFYPLTGRKNFSLREMSRFSLEMAAFQLRAGGFTGLFNSDECLETPVTIPLLKKVLIKDFTDYTNLVNFLGVFYPEDSFTKCFSRYQALLDALAFSWKLKLGVDSQVALEYWLSIAHVFLEESIKKNIDSSALMHAYVLAASKTPRHLYISSPFTFSSSPELNAYREFLETYCPDFYRNQFFSFFIKTLHNSSSDATIDSFDTPQIRTYSLYLPLDWYFYCLYFYCPDNLRKRSPEMYNYVHFLETYCPGFYLRQFANFMKSIDHVVDKSRIPDSVNPELSMAKLSMAKSPLIKVTFTESPMTESPMTEKQFLKIVLDLLLRINAANKHYDDVVKKLDGVLTINGTNPLVNKIRLNLINCHIMSNPQKVTVSDYPLLENYLGFFNCYQKNLSAGLSPNYSVESSLNCAGFPNVEQLYREYLAERASGQSFDNAIRSVLILDLLNSLIDFQKIRLLKGSDLSPEQIFMALFEENFNFIKKNSLLSCPFYLDKERVHFILASALSDNVLQINTLTTNEIFVNNFNKMQVLIKMSLISDHLERFIDLDPSLKDFKTQIIKFLSTYKDVNYPFSILTEKLAAASALSKDSHYFVDPKIQEGFELVQNYLSTLKSNPTLEKEPAAASAPTFSRYHFAVKFDSYMKPVEYLNEYQIRLLEVDKRVVLPIQTGIRLLISSYDVLHSWAIPSMGIKLDGCPGRLNQTFLYIKDSGLFYGQCSEICGTQHAFMPISVRSIPAHEFNFWLAQQIKPIEQLSKYLEATH